MQVSTNIRGGGGQLSFPAKMLSTSAPFEGAEKLLEVWFAPSPGHVPNEPSPHGKLGLRKVPRDVWDDMLAIVRCRILSSIEGDEMDAYLLRLVSTFLTVSFRPPTNIIS